MWRCKRAWKFFAHSALCAAKCCGFTARTFALVDGITWKLRFIDTLCMTRRFLVANPFLGETHLIYNIAHSCALSENINFVQRMKNPFLALFGIIMHCTMHDFALFCIIWHYLALFGIIVRCMIFLLHCIAILLHCISRAACFSDFIFWYCICSLGQWDAQAHTRHQGGRPFAHRSAKHVFPNCARRSLASRVPSTRSGGGPPSWRQPVGA